MPTRAASKREAAFLKESLAAGNSSTTPAQRENVTPGGNALPHRNIINKRPQDGDNVEGISIRFPYTNFSKLSNNIY
jgi:hypothetical protein